MIEVRHLTKNYGDRAAIHDLNFKIEKGDVVGLLGPNGAGKSTTMKILTGFMAPTEGVALIGGIDVFENPLEAKKKIGYLPETPPLYVDMTVKEYLTYVAELKQVPPERISAAVTKALQKTQLESVGARVIRNLSKGFKQRVGIAQALVSEPEILVLDEPTVGLDPKQVAEIRDLICQLRGSHTIILSTHILSEVQATCNKVIIIHQGRIVAQDTIEHLARRNGSANTVFVQTRQFVKELDIFSAISGFQRLEILSDGKSLVHFSGAECPIDEVARVVLQSAMGLVEIREQKNQLEDVFLQLTYGTGLPAAEGVL
jgi:ABC-2 type transport system ATP-binding protein